MKIEIFVKPAENVIGLCAYILLCFLSIYRNQGHLCFQSRTFTPRVSRYYFSEWVCMTVKCLCGPHSQSRQLFDHYTVYVL